ncbi:MAG: hypothetical protein H0U27_14250 [Nitrosopumilus sp.]|nr:hypothetical protein [Nitrosopumilus sp.]
MSNNLIKHSLTALLIITVGFSSLHANFISPSQKHLEFISFEEIKKALSIRKITPVLIEDFVQITDREEEGFLGYHGDSLDFLIYQDIIRHVIEIIVDIPVRDDFHFLAAPLDPLLKIQDKSKLSNIFLKETNPNYTLMDTTFPLNFSIWDNANRVGFNTLENYVKNESNKTRGYDKRLKWFFANLGIAEKEIEVLFTVARKQLKNPKGVILQFFDTSLDPYAFSKQIAYPAFPSGCISENITVDKYFMNPAFNAPFPHEVRLLLDNKKTLNPNNHLRIVRHHPEVSDDVIQKYETDLKNKIKQLSYNTAKKDAYRKKLQQIWEL